MRSRAATMLGVLLCLCGIVAAETPGIWLDVPFVRQEKDGCGAASIAMVMQYWMHQQGRPLDDSADAVHIQRTLFSSRAHGIYASDLRRYFEQSGFQTFTFRGERADLEQHLDKGRPLIVALKPGSGNVPLHYVVVAGLDSGLVLINDPAQRKLLKRDWSSFEREWSAADKWTLLALPQARVP